MVARACRSATGAVNEKGLDFYDRLVDALLAKNIEPALTLYHWDLPQALQDLGGWANRDDRGPLRRLRGPAVRALGDRVTRWITLNEPIIFTEMGYRRASWRPGIRDLTIDGRGHPPRACSPTARPSQAFRASGRAGEIGITNANTSYEPADDTPGNAGATELARDFDARLFHGPVYGKGYPQSVLEYYAAHGAPPPDRAGRHGRHRQPDRLPRRQPLLARARSRPTHAAASAIAPRRRRCRSCRWATRPRRTRLGDFVRWVSNEYGRPQDLHHRERRLRQHRARRRRDRRPRRIELLAASSPGLHGAIEDGATSAPTTSGRCCDNFEWAFGYSKRFGMVYTDFDTQKRIPKQSAAFYSEVIRNNGVEG